MYFHYIRDKDHKGYYGRLWLGSLHVELAIPSSFWHMELVLNDGENTALGLNVALGFFAIWIHFENRKLWNFLEKFTKRKGQRYTNGRRIGWSFFGKSLRISLWEDETEWSRSDPKWWYFNIDFAKIIKGKPTFSRTIIEERNITIPMPEKSYEATAKVEIFEWKYPRWFAKKSKSVNIEVPERIPKEGKGESAHDCGVDATYGMSCGANSIPEAVGKLVGSVLSDRVNYGGWNDWNWTKPRD